MTKRERIEDLGRIAVLANSLGDHKIFQLYHGRRKDIHDWWASLNEEQKGDFLHEIAYGLDDVSEKIMDIWAIAMGDDEKDD